MKESLSKIDSGLPGDSIFSTHVEMKLQGVDQDRECQSQKSCVRCGQKLEKCNRGVLTLEDIATTRAKEITHRSRPTSPVHPIFTIEMEILLIMNMSSTILCPALSSPADTRLPSLPQVSLCRHFTCYFFLQWFHFHHDAHHASLDLTRRLLP